MKFPRKMYAVMHAGDREILNEQYASLGQSVFTNIDTAIKVGDEQVRENDDTVVIVCKLVPVRLVKISTESIVQQLGE